MRKIFNCYLLEVIFILLLGLVPLLWYKPGYMGLGHDMSYPLAPIDFFQDRLFTWTDRWSAFGANQNDDLAGFFIHGLEALVVFAGLPLILSQKLVFIFWFVLPGITMYVFLRSLYPEKEKFIIRLSGSLFYVLNHYLLQAWFMAEMTKISIISAIPLVSLLIINVVIKRKPVCRSSILLAVTLFFLNGGPGIPLWGGLILISLILLFSLFLFSTERFILRLKRLISFILLSTIFLAFLNSYWIYPYLKSYGQSYTQNIEAAGGLVGVVNWSQMISKNTSFSNLFKMQGITEWYDSPEHPYSNVFFSNPFLIFLSIFFPVLGFVGMLKKKGESRNESIYKASFLAILLIGVVLSAGSHPPFGKFYDFVLQNIPLFPMFRSGVYKFGMVLWFGSAFFLALGTYSIANFVAYLFREKLSTGKISLLIFVVFSILLSVYNYPFFTGSFFNWSAKYSTMVKVPDYIFDTKKEIDKNKFSTRTLLLPPLDVDRYTVSYDWGYYSLAPLFYILGRSSAILNQPRLNYYENGLIEAIYSQLAKNGKSELLKFTSAGRAIVQNDFNSQEHMEYDPYGSMSKVASSDILTLSSKVGKWDFYSVDKNKIMPLIYSPTSISYVLSSTENFPLVTEIPLSPFLGEAFYQYTPDVPSEDLSGFKGLFNQYYIEGKCTNCEKQTKIMFDSTPLLITPGSRSYSVIKLLQQFHKNSLTDLVKRNQYILETMGRKIGGLGVAFYSDTQQSRSTIDDILNDLEEIKSNHYSLLSDFKKDSDEANIYQFLKYYSSLVGQWKVAASDKQIASKLGELDRSMTDLMSELNLNSAVSLWGPETFIYDFDLTIPKAGYYKLSLYSPDKNLENLDVTINGEKTNLKQVDRGSGWMQSPVINFSESRLKLTVPQINILSNEQVVVGDSKLVSAREGERCQFYDISQNEMGQKVNYRIEFEQRIEGEDFPKIQIIERNDELHLTDAEKGFDHNNETFDSNKSHAKTVIIYKPSFYAKKAALKLCFGAQDKQSTDLITNFRVIPLYPTPIIFASSVESEIEGLQVRNIEFVSLNQTKYLIRLKNVPKKFVLNFNSRFDTQWVIREVDSQKAAGYFNGQKAEYLNGRVVEYNKLDQHLVTDLLFPQVGHNAISPSIVLNGFANGWLVDNNSSAEKVYLLEYNYQNDLYKAAVVSICTLVIITLLYAAKRS